MSSDIFVLSFFSLFFNCLQIQGGRGGTTGQSVRILTYAHIIAPHRFINCLSSLGLLSILAFIVFRAFVVGVCRSAMVCSNYLYRCQELAFMFRFLIGGFLLILVLWTILFKSTVITLQNLVLSSCFASIQYKTSKRFNAFVMKVSNLYFAAFMRFLIILLQQKIM